MASCSLRWTGGGLAVLIAAAVAGSIHALLPQFPAVWVGVPVAAVVSWSMTPPALDPSRSTCGIVAILSMATMMLGAWGVGIALMATGVRDPSDAIASGLAVGSYGIVLLGLPAWLILTFPVRLWLWLLRAVATRNGSPRTGSRR